MKRTFRRDRVRRATVLRFALLGALALVLVVPAASFGGQAKKAAPQSSAAACQLQVFSWWTGGGEAAGLEKLIGIWNKSQPETASSRTRPSPAARARTRRQCSRSGSRRTSRRTRSRATRAPSSATTSRPARSSRSTSSTRSTSFDKVMPASLINQIKYKGHIYSVPVNIHRANVLWYNPKVLKKAGITKAPTNVGRVHRRAGQGEGGGRDPAVARRAVDAEAPARDRHDRDARPDRLGHALEEGRELEHAG